ncbi:MmgE/PrpD family protein [Advenella sp. WQ 585]|uniref:MmgE/PrpD family protein n=1 Tax=Advenella mandrilli TaxID=2800330 RepID=A0ABS1EES2_9BURK|nr:MmgE/PrpD family protein [Advenella mandrilli]MBK1780100.1 MmgE/PrpD family protein [Advenella mandrilli]
MILRTIAEYGARDTQATLPDNVVQHAKRAVLDWLAALYPGAAVSPGIELIKACQDELGVGRASVIGYDTSAFAATAAWINGSVSHSVEFDDIFRDAVYHPGCPVISAALAVAQSKNTTGLQLLNAIVVGYEISTRIGAAVQPSHYKYFHTTGTVGCIGAAAAVAALCAPGNANVMQHAIATATTFASGLQQAFRSDAMTKALHAGHAAAVGVRAGQAAAAGVTGVEDILEGEVGFAAALSAGANWKVALAGLGEEYNITRITRKNHACCGHTFSSIDSALALLHQHGFRIADIERIQIETYQTAIDVTGNFEPGTAFEAKFSLPYVVSHALLFGSVRLDAFDGQKLADKSLRKLMKKISLSPDSDMTAQFPLHRSARVTIVLTDGNTYTHYAKDRKGDPELPLTDEELNNKFDELVIPVLNKEKAEKLKQQIWQLDKLNVNDLVLA